MATRAYDSATQRNITLTATELNPSIIDFLIEDIHIEFQVFKTLSQVWIHTKSIPDSKQNLFILQLLW